MWKSSKITNRKPKGERKMIKESHSLRIRPDRWDAIEKKAWQLSNEAGQIIKPTDIADAILWKGIKDIKLEDVGLAKKTRKKEQKTT